MQKWEYRTTDWITEEELNQLGSEGWELVAAVHTGYTSSLFFKRLKS